MRYLLIFLFLVCFYLSNAQEYFANIRKIEMEQGLSHYRVDAFYPTQEGMWIGTADGLNFFDGYNWKYWKKEQGDFEYKSINFIHKDQNQLLWLFNNKSNEFKKEIQSIYILDPESGITRSFEDIFGKISPFDKTDIQNVFEDGQNQLYFLTNHQFWRYSKDSSFELLNLPQDFIPHSIFSDGTLIGILREKLTLVSSSGKVINSFDELKGAKNFQVLGTPQQFIAWDVYMPCFEFKLKENQQYEISRFAIQPQKKRFKLVRFDSVNHHYWIYSEPYLHLFDADGNLLYRHKNFPRVSCIDNKGNFWMGKFGISVFRLEQKKFKRYLYHEPDNLRSDNAYHCRGMIEKDGKLYVTSYRGTQAVDLKTGSFKPTTEELDLGFVVVEDRQKHIWGGKRKVKQFDESYTRLKKTYINKSRQSKIWSMYEDADGKIWVGATSGLSYVESGELKTFNKYNNYPELKHANVLFFYQDRSGVIWLGGNDGLYQLDPKKGIVAGFGKTRTGKNYLPTSKFQHMYQDASGIYWIATEDIGLLRWDREKDDVQQFDKKSGFLTNNIYGLYEDEYGFLWLSSFNGLVRFERTTNNFTIFNDEDGITHNEFNRISHYQAADGRLFFGGQNGVTELSPKDFLSSKSNHEELELLVNHITVFGKEELRDTLPDGSNIDLLNLAAGARVIDLEMKVSDVFWTDRIELHYRLLELDSKGGVVHNSKRNVSTDNHIELFGMKPGTYQLEIKTIKKNGKQLGKTLLLPLNIAPPFYQTASFWSLMVFLLGLSFWSLMKFRTKHLQRRKAELEKLVTERTAQILRNQKTITSQAEQIADMREQLNRKDQLWLEQFQSIVSDRLADPNLSLPSVIDDMDIGRSVFYEKVKALTNMTPNQYIQELRLVKAKTILEEGAVKTVKEVTYSVGMNHPNYFSKLFKERFGISPSTYFRDQKN